MKKRYRTVNDYYREIFGEKIFKLPIDAGFDCPNRDGTVAHGGCTFCTVSGSGDAIVAPEAPIREQFYHEIDFMHLTRRGHAALAKALADWIPALL